MPICMPINDLKQNVHNGHTNNQAFYIFVIRARIYNSIGMYLLIN